MSIRADFEEAKKKGRREWLESELSTFLRELPAKIMERKANASENPDAADFVHVLLESDNKVTRAELRSSDAYKALHAYCSRPDIDVQIRCDMTGGFFLNKYVSFVNVYISKPYEASDDVRAMRKMGLVSKMPPPS